MPYDSLVKVQADSDTRNRIWEEVFKTYYDSYYQEILVHDLINRWQFLDDAAKCTVALTASGSAISGWALWMQPGGRWLWGLLAGVGAVLAILQVSLGVPARISQWRDVRQYFAALRIDLETFRSRMRIDQAFPIGQYSQEFEQFRKRYGEGIPDLRKDILLTSALKKKAQTELDVRLSDETI